MGDLTGRIRWRSSGGAVVSFTVPDPGDLVREPGSFGVLPSSATMRLLRGEPLEEPEAEPEPESEESGPG